LVTKPGSNEKSILLMGHRDTVFPKGEVARRPFTIEGGRAYGPGVADMKAGLVINAFVAAAFTASVGTPTICGVGPVGGNAHTALEYLDLNSIVPRAQALALAILRTGVD
jgi:acetylornithine deacetylase/succinyl-diaminopimelate desuccinylase-like protein